MQGPEAKALAGLKKGAWLIASLNPFGRRDRVEDYAKAGIEALALEFMPRILPPSDTEMALALQKLLEKQGLKFRFNTAAQGVEIKNGKARVSWKSGEQTGVAPRWLGSARTNRTRTCTRLRNRRPTIPGADAHPRGGGCSASRRTAGRGESRPGVAGRGGRGSLTGWKSTRKRGLAASRPYEFTSLSEQIARSFSALVPELQ